MQGMMHINVTSQGFYGPALINPEKVTHVTTSNSGDGVLNMDSGFYLFSGIPFQDLQQMWMKALEKARQMRGQDEKVVLLSVDSSHKGFEGPAVIDITRISHIATGTSGVGVFFLNGGAKLFVAHSFEMCQRLWEASLDKREESKEVPQECATPGL